MAFLRKDQITHSPCDFIDKGDVEVIYMHVSNGRSIASSFFLFLPNSAFHLIFASPRATSKRRPCTVPPWAAICPPGKRTISPKSFNPPRCPWRVRARAQSPESWPFGAHPNLFFFGFIRFSPRQLLLPCLLFIFQGPGDAESWDERAESGSGLRFARIVIQRENN